MGYSDVEIKEIKKTLRNAAFFYGQKSRNDGFFRAEGHSLKINDA